MRPPRKTLSQKEKLDLKGGPQKEGVRGNEGGEKTGRLVVKEGDWKGSGGGGGEQKTDSWSSGRGKKEKE